MKSVCQLFFVGLSIAQTCSREVEMVIAQDASSSFGYMVEEMPSLVERMFSEMNLKIGKVKASLAAFIDKPIPYRGIGGGRGHPEPLDYCYKSDKSPALTTDVDSIKNAYRWVSSIIGNGGDFPENPHEAILYAALDPKFGWSQIDSNRYGFSKIIVVITDDLAHVEGQAYTEAIEYWNKNKDGYDPNGYQFWDGNFAQSADFYNFEEDGTKYQELYELNVRGYDTLNSQEKLRYDSLYGLLGPDEYPIPIEHSYSFSAASNCTLYEYPDPKKVGAILRSHQITPIILLNKPKEIPPSSWSLCSTYDPNNDYTEKTLEKYTQCMMNSYINWMKDYGIVNYAVDMFDSSTTSFVEILVDRIDKITGHCTSTAPPPTTTESTTTESTTTESTTTESTTTESTTTESSTTKPTTTESSTTKPTDQCHCCCQNNCRCCRNNCGC